MPPNANQDDAARTDAHPARQAALDWLLARINYERTTLPYLSRQLKLDRMRQLLTRLGQPDAGLKIIHVAGTKGKGSTSAMIAAMLTAAGYRTGFFSSPHLERIEERFVVDGEPCTADELVALIARVRAEVRTMDEEAVADGDSDGGPTYFEITTAMALLHFVEHQADAAILEVGLGGRLDSTNVCLPVVSVITSISFDHMRQLGNTLAAIAAEKAGIIKPGVPVVCGVTNEEPQTVVAAIAREHGCRLLQIGRDFQFEYHPAQEKRKGDTEKGRGGEISSHSQSPCLLVSPSLNFQSLVAGQETTMENLHLAMRGAHQAANAAVALATVAELRHQGWCISTDAMRAGLVQASLPGRVEILSGTPAVVLDTAHNPASAHALVETLAEMPSTVRRSLIVSISHDKDVPAVVRELVPHFQRIIVTQYQENPRAVPVETLAEIVRTELSVAGLYEAGPSAPVAGLYEAAPSAPVAGLSEAGSSANPPGSQTPATVLISCPTPEVAWELAVQSAVPGELFCITGSFFLAAEMRPLVLKTHAAETLIPVIRL